MRFRVPSVAVAALVAACMGLAACGSDPAAMALGQEAVVEHSPVGGGTDGPRTKLGVTVLGVRTGALADLEAAGFSVDEDQKDKTPIYVDTRFENKGTETIDRELSVSLRDQDDSLISPVVVFNYGDVRFQQCPDQTEGELAPGESFETCELFFLDPGREARLVTFLPNLPGSETGFLYWTTS
jgi:hypothetical protein